MRTITMLLVLPAFPAVAQSKAGNSDAISSTLQELVSEVRQLCQSLERSASENVRTQVLLHRMKLQDQ